MKHKFRSAGRKQRGATQRVAKVSFKFSDEYENPKSIIHDAFQFAAKIHDLGDNPPQAASGAIWLRGQADGRWELQPAIGRRDPMWLGLRLYADGTTTEHMENVESNLLHRFRRYAHSILQRETNRWETIILAQHHGLPTRLLDWTSNPLAALYFATESLADQDGAVFAIRPIRRFTEYLCVHDDEPLFPLHVREPLTVKGIKILFPMMNSDRLIAQSAAFTIQSPWISLNSQATQQFEAGTLDIVEMFRWRVPKEQKIKILRQLDRVGINHRSLFPDLGGAGVGLFRSQMLRTDTLIRTSDQDESGQSR
jgi:FRG domain